jgi:5-methylcytosine-specific restriction protein B
MARLGGNRDVAPILSAAEHWINSCLIQDGSMFTPESLWTAGIVQEVYGAFVEHPDFGQDNFITKLKSQMANASIAAKRLAAEMLWILLLFPSNVKPRTKVQQIREVWELSGQPFPEDHPYLKEEVLIGIGSGGMGFNNYRPDELAFLIVLTRALKQIDSTQRKQILGEYDQFVQWIETQKKGNRQFRHMLRFFAFPDRVERMSSNNDRRKILDAFGIATLKVTRDWPDHALDDALAKLRAALELRYPSEPLDFYRPPLRETWSPERTVKTPSGEITVTVPQDSDEREDDDVDSPASVLPDARESIQV